MPMTKTLVGTFLLLFAIPAIAFVAEKTEVSKTYEVVELDYAPEVKQAYVGNLDNYPVMYEMSSDEPFKLTTQVWQRYRSGNEPAPLSLIAVSVNKDETGVTEVARLRPSKDDWVLYKDKKLGMTFWVAPKMEEEVEAGVYRVEVSTPNNQGDFMVVFGDIEQNAGYFKTLSSIRIVQNNFGYGIFRMLLASPVYYTLGIIFLLLAFYKTWQYRKLISNGSN